MNQDIVAESYESRHVNESRHVDELKHVQKCLYVIFDQHLSNLGVGYYQCISIIIPYSRYNIKVGRHFATGVIFITNPDLTITEIAVKVKLCDVFEIKAHHTYQRSTRG